MVLAHRENGRRFRLAWYAERNAFAGRLVLYEHYFQGDWIRCGPCLLLPNLWCYNRQGRRSFTAHKAVRQDPARRCAGYQRRPYPSQTGTRGWSNDEPHQQNMAENSRICGFAVESLRCISGAWRSGCSRVCSPSWRLTHFVGLSTARSGTGTCLPHRLLHWPILRAVC